MIFSRKVIYFLKLVETKNFAKAAECLSITTSALRYSILNFEKELGKSLLVKKEGGIELTEYGHFLYAAVFDSIKHLDITLVRGELIGGERKRVKVMVEGFYNPALIGSLMLNQRKFDVEFIIAETYSSAMTDLRDGKCDIAICSHVIRPVEFDDDIDKFFLSRESIGFLVNKETLARYTSIKELLGSEVLFQRSNMFCLSTLPAIKEQLTSCGVSCKLVGVPDFTDVLKILCQGDGVTMLSSEMISYLSVKDERLEFIVNPFSIDLTLERWLYFKKSDCHDILTIAERLKETLK